MPAKKKHSPAARFFRSKAFVITLILVVLFVAYGYGRAFYQDYKIRQEIRQLQDDIRSLETKKLESLEILDYVTSDAFVEREARRSLNLKESGEEVYVLSDATSSASARAITVTEASDAHLNNPTKWWYYFIHKDIPNNS